MVGLDIMVEWRKQWMMVLKIIVFGEGDKEEGLI